MGEMEWASGGGGVEFGERVWWWRTMWRREVCRACETGGGVHSSDWDTAQQRVVRYTKGEGGGEGRLHMRGGGAQMDSPHLLAPPARGAEWRGEPANRHALPVEKQRHDRQWEFGQQLEIGHVRNIDRQPGVGWVRSAQ